ncbi:MAG: hypothetical protein LKF41_04720 [Bifidobacterium sp.]|jgi:hypothetical protein|nr:hypothetical protein [Bifidobacterium sp.]MCH4175145.1 hypothetical protein [Bifidobacterium sp.]
MAFYTGDIGGGLHLWACSFRNNHHSEANWYGYVVYALTEMALPSLIIIGIADVVDRSHEKIFAWECASSDMAC